MFVKRKSEKMEKYCTGCRFVKWQTVQWSVTCEMAGLKERTYIYVINVEDFGLKEEPQSPGLLDGVGQLTVCLRTGTREHI